LVGAFEIPVRYFACFSGTYVFALLLFSEKSLFLAAKKSTFAPAFLKAARSSAIYRTKSRAFGRCPDGIGGMY